MKTTLKNLSFVVSASLLALVACTDKREPASVPAPCIGCEPVDLITNEAIAEVQYRGARTETLQMYQAGGALLLSGKPFGFSQWDVLSNPESPYLTSAMAEQINTFTDPATPWLPDNYASGALMAVGNYVIGSGRAGATVIDTSSPSAPREVRRYPPMAPNTGSSVVIPTIPSDPQYQWKGMAKHPTLPIVYGFSEQTKAYRLKMTGPNLALETMQDYISGGTMCCVLGATNFQNKIFVAFRSHMYVYTPQADGSLGNASMITALQAVNVQATSRFLYVHHQPSAADPVVQTMPAGIYVFDAGGNNIAYINVNPLRFTVSPTDSHIFANDDNNSIRIYKILWTNM